MKPNAKKHNPDPCYIRELIERAGLSQNQAAAAIGVSPRMMRYYVGIGDAGRPAPYPIQYALEGLA